MSDYFDEMGWTPLRDGEAPNHLLHIVRLFRDFGMWELLGQHDKLPPPTSKAALEALERIQITKENVKQCPICLKDFEEGNTVIAMPCKHSFHHDCIVPWLQKTNSCPLCRHELPTDDEEYELIRKEKQRTVQREKDLEILHNSMFM